MPWSLYGWICLGLMILPLIYPLFLAYLSISDGRRRRYTLENGTATHGWLVQANPALFEPGFMRNAALIVISPDQETNDDEEFMTDLAGRVMDLKGEKGETKDERKVARLMADEAYITGQRDELPRGFTDGKEVFLVHIMVYREHLPGRKIKGNKIPCAIVWDEPGTIICTRPGSRRRKRFDDDDE